MKFTRTPLLGSYLIDIEPRNDDRGFFARFFCQSEFAQHGLETNFVQGNVSLSVRRGTLRGMHYQTMPQAEVKLVRCITGSIFDVIVDLRPDSSTFQKWFGHELTAKNRIAMYVPRGFAHGFVTRTDDTEVQYLVSENYSPTNENGVRYNDPRFAIVWPEKPRVISDKDAGFPDFGSGAAVEGFRGLT